MRKALLPILLGVLCFTGAVVGEDLAVVEFDLYPSSFEPNDLCSIVPEWLLDQLAEHSPYSCKPIVLTKDYLEQRRIVGDDQSLVPSSIDKILRKENCDLLVIGSITADLYSGSLTITASLIDKSKRVIQSGTIVSTSIDEIQSSTRDLCFALLDQESPSGNATPVAKIAVSTQISNYNPGTSMLTVYRHESLTLDSSDSYDIDGTLERVEWDFGADGSTDEYQREVRCDSLTSNTGVYVILLRVVDSFGAIDEERLEITVLDESIQDVAVDSNIKPQAILTITDGGGRLLDRPAFLDEKLTLSAGESYDPDGRIVVYEWDLDGDGNPDHIASEFTTGTVTAESGEWMVSLYVEDEFGAYSYDQWNLEVLDETEEQSLRAVSLSENVHPQASFRILAEDGKVLDRPAFIGERLTLDASGSEDPDGTILRFTWDLDQDENPDHVAVSFSTLMLTDEAGMHRIKLCVEDNLGITDCMIHDIEVSETTYDEHLAGDNLAPIAYIEVVRSAGNRNETGSKYVLFRDEALELSATSSYDADGHIAEYRWTINGEESPVGYRSTLRVPDLTAVPGQYEVSLSVIDDGGSRTQNRITLTVLDYTSEQVNDMRMAEEVVPAFRRAIMFLMGIGLIAGVGYLIWYFGW